MVVGTLMLSTPSIGRAQTWIGRLSAFGYQSGETPQFYVTSHRMIEHVFSCPLSSYGSHNIDPGSFIIDVQGGTYDGSVVANHTETDGYGDHQYSRSGTYSQQVISGCSWHIKAIKGF
jgi:hypothetical protein